jgi:hypothetical protein
MSKAFSPFALRAEFAIVDMPQRNPGDNPVAIILACHFLMTFAAIASMSAAFPGEIAVVRHS